MLAINFQVEYLPESITFSPLEIALDHGKTLTLLRRDLFDARFQLISEEREVQTDLEFIDAPSDLVPGTYEGGLKTWECSLDLIRYLARLSDTDLFVGEEGVTKILEVLHSCDPCSFSNGCNLDWMWHSYAIHLSYATAVHSDECLRERTICHTSTRLQYLRLALGELMTCKIQSILIPIRLLCLISY